MYRELCQSGWWGIRFLPWHHGSGISSFGDADVYYQHYRSTSLLIGLSSLELHDYLSLQVYNTNNYKPYNYRIDTPIIISICLSSKISL